MSNYFGTVCMTLQKIDKDRLPSHIAIIMDGNGRWAKEQGQDRLVWSLSWSGKCSQYCRRLRRTGIEYLTLYAFSTENWDRPNMK